MRRCRAPLVMSVMIVMETARLLLFVTLWTVIWAAPLPRLSRRGELAAGLIPFVAFGLRVFAGFFVGVPADDPMRIAVRPVLDWVNDTSHALPYQWVLDGTVAIGLIWLTSAFDIPRVSRLATIWIMPVVAIASIASVQLTGLPLERVQVARIPAPLVGLAAGGIIGGIIAWTPGPLEPLLRRKAACAAIVIAPLATAIGGMLLGFSTTRAGGEASAVESVIALATGSTAGVAALLIVRFQSLRSRLLFALAVGVAVGAIVAQTAARLGT